MLDMTAVIVDYTFKMCSMLLRVVDNRWLQRSDIT